VARAAVPYDTMPPHVAGVFHPLQQYTQPPPPDCGWGPQAASGSAADPFAALGLAGVSAQPRHPSAPPQPPDDAFGDFAAPPPPFVAAAPRAYYSHGSDTSGRVFAPSPYTPYPAFSQPVAVDTVLAGGNGGFWAGAGARVSLA
jgi:hypothetical protein